MIVRDNFLPAGVLRSVAATWPGPTSGNWYRYPDGKLASKGPDRMPAAARLAIERLAEIDVADMLGIPEAFPDLEYLHGAGLHQINAGGSLGLHLDSERHPLLPWRRDASAVLWLDDCDGGALEFCDGAGDVQEAVECRFNRLVLFATPGQWHRVAETRSVRRSLCLFFWSLGTEAGQRDRAEFV